MARRVKSLLCIVLTILLLVGCGPTSNVVDTNPTGDQAQQPEINYPTLEERLAEYAKLGSSPDDNYRTWYEIFVYSFYDSNGDGIGDLQGVIAKLDYLQTLGINGIWLMPIHPSTSYHKYNVDDYYDIDPAYGTMSDFEQLIAACDQRGIKVIIDLVVNHSGVNNPWFVEACDYLRTIDISDSPDPEECKYVEYYNFYKTTEAHGESMRMVTDSDYYYEGMFSPDMPDLNWGCQAMREDVKAIMEFWLNKGVAGFRVDAAKEFYSGSVPKNVEVMQWLQDTAESIKPDVYMVAEVWETNYVMIKDYYKSGFTSIFNYPYGNTTGKLMQVVNNRGNDAVVSTWAKALQTSSNAYKEANPDYIDAPFLSNHDVLRISDGVAADPLRIKMAGAMNLFMGGGTFIYYGEEIGMSGTSISGDDPSKRAPMYWNVYRNYGMTNPPTGCKVPAEYPQPSADDQMKDENSTFNYYREAIAIRNALPMIARGDNIVEEALNIGCVSAVRKSWNGEECIILMNIDDDEAGIKVDLSAYSDWKLAATLSATGDPITMDGTTLNMPAYGTAVLIPAK